MQKPREEALREWLISELLGKSNVWAIAQLFTVGIPVRAHREIIDVPVACVCGRYETFGTRRDNKSITMYCDSCNLLVHKTCIRAAHPGLSQPKYVDAMFNPPKGVSRVSVALLAGHVITLSTLCNYPVTSVDAIIPFIQLWMLDPVHLSNYEKLSCA